MPRWDPTVREVMQIRRNKFLVRTTTFGTQTLGLVGAIPYDRISWQYEGSFIQGITFRVALADKLAQVDVTAKVSPVLSASKVEEMLELQLAALKQYAEYLAGGGNPEAFLKSSGVWQGIGWTAL
ncbi:MAG: hypothetical protein RBG13Loki_2674 [Promethearchaeota archaeon CR_4]|nr:MAG: hypothetical protein RBG13Loki_2674 [Candidatus Lokiarchaeota archaeon CR_4]